MIQVSRVCGQARFSALTTGSTCTASPSALSMTMAMCPGGDSEEGLGTVAGLERRAQLTSQRFAGVLLPFGQRALQTLPHRFGAGFVQVRAIEIQNPRFGSLRRPANQDVLEVEIGMVQPRGCQLPNQPTRR